MKKYGGTSFSAGKEDGYLPTPTKLSAVIKIISGQNTALFRVKKLRGKVYGHEKIFIKNGDRELSYIGREANK